jgi:hypothetical protein
MFLDAALPQRRGLLLVVKGSARQATFPSQLKADISSPLQNPGPLRLLG